MDEDYLLALQLQEQFNQEANSTPREATDLSNAVPIGLVGDENAILGQWVAKKETPKAPGSETWSVVDPRWETIDPLPDARALFIEFNHKYFWGKLDSVEVRWSPRMTSCAGLCCYEGRGGLCSVRLSEPLLKLRPRSDFVNTLLHEMVHAYLFVTANNKDHDAHGPEFHKHMYRINKESGSNITVYHTFHDEVANYKQHWWKCDGPCQKWSPFFGMVKRSMNRAPHPRDPWFPDHQRKCGGTFHKVKEPEGYGEKKSKKKEPAEKKPAAAAASGSKDIRDMFDSKSKEGGDNDKNCDKKSNPGLPANVSHPKDPPRNGHDSPDHGEQEKFPGMGKAIGGGGTVTGPIMRRIPGIGVISSGRPSTASATVSRPDSPQEPADGAPGCSSGNRDHAAAGAGNKKRVFSSVISDSDSDDDLLIPVLKKERKAVEGKFGPMDCFTPGKGMKIPGFKSVSNRTSDPAKMESRAADRNRRVMDLGSTSEETTDDEDCVPLSSVIRRAPGPASGGDRGGADNIVVSDQSRSPVIRDTAGEGTGTEDDSIVIEDSPPPPLHHIGEPPPGTSSQSQPPELAVATQPAISIPSIDPFVDCPVCSTPVPTSQINMHLDSCLS